MAGQLPAPPAGSVYQLSSADASGVDAPRDVHLRRVPFVPGAVRHRPVGRNGSDDHAGARRRRAGRAGTAGGLRRAAELRVVPGRSSRRSSEPARGRPTRAPSSARRARLRSMPPAYPVSDPSAPPTRWHGTTIEIGFLATAAPTARAAPGIPRRAASSPYVRVSPRRDGPELLPDAPLECRPPRTELGDLPRHRGAGERCVQRGPNCRERLGILDRRRVDGRPAPVPGEEAAGQDRVAGGRTLADQEKRAERAGVMRVEGGTHR